MFGWRGLPLDHQEDDPRDDLGWHRSQCDAAGEREGDQQVRPLRDSGGVARRHEPADQEVLQEALPGVPPRQEPGRPARRLPLHPDHQGLCRAHRRGGPAQLREVRQPRRPPDLEGRHRTAALPPGEGQQHVHPHRLLLRHHRRGTAQLHLLLPADQELCGQRGPDRDAALPGRVRHGVHAHQGLPGAPGRVRREPDHAHAADRQRAHTEARGSRRGAQEAQLYTPGRHEEPVPRLGAHAAAPRPLVGGAPGGPRRGPLPLDEGHAGHD
mmetsp:Transcript_70333/g.184363  ORF Transcript_70333/g.184363 Transcript_70333/m.184363 type:complete len:269 (+) Transcript_70333:408-1214(+)